jgi:hypothetical protein
MEVKNTQKGHISIKDDDLKIDPELLRVMQMSLHPPHAMETDVKGHKHVVPNPAFPYCLYGSKAKGQGTYWNAYQEYYCDAFQTTFNEFGLCYTFNNADQGLDDFFHS